MADFQDDIAQVAFDLAAEFPVVVTFVQATTTENQTTGEVITTSTQEFDVTCPPPFDFEEKFVNGTTVLTGDQRLIIPTKNLGFVPTLLQSCSFDQLVDGQTVHFECEIIPPLIPYSTGSRIGAYEAHLRQIRS